MLVTAWADVAQFCCRGTTSEGYVSGENTMLTQS